MTKPAQAFFADAVAVPQRLLDRWANELSQVEFTVALTMVGETWRYGRAEAACPVERLVGWWGALQRHVAADEIERALRRLVALGALHELPPEPNSADHTAYRLNRVWHANQE